MPTRRCFLARSLGFGVTTTGVVAALGLDAYATSGSGSATLWTLDPSSCGPGRCACRACVRHAANKVFLSEAEAEAGRAHPGCRCTVRPQVVSEPGHRELAALAAAGLSLDRRTPAVAAALDSSGSAARDPVPTAPPSPPPAPSGPAPKDPVQSPPSEVRPNAVAGASEAGLAFTGTDLVVPAGVAAATMAVGAMLVAVHRRRATVDGAESPTRERTASS